jgi:hypothetical protein
VAASVNLILRVPVAAGDPEPPQEYSDMTSNKMAHEDINHLNNLNISAFSLEKFL